MRDCIEFRRKRDGRKTRDPYGWVYRNGKRQRAHRAAYEEAHGPIPPGMVVRHKCDNPPCINPAHLELGTRADNNRDMWQRGRGVVPEPPRLRGEQHPQSKLTDQQRQEIIASPLPSRRLASIFGVSHATIVRTKRMGAQLT